ncbi:MAG: DNA recombination protein RmuC [Gammaproteobacteria bacterium]|nr:DNA recombination protein RmuC [Gammaproteobacteria bacterium]
MSIEILYLIIFMLALAALTGWLMWWLSARSIKSLQAEHKEKDSKINNLEQEIRKNINELQAIKIKEATAQERLEGLKSTQKTLGEQMKNEFSAVAQELLRRNSQHFAESSQDKIQGLLKPFADNINGFRQRVNEIHDSSVRNFGAMEKSVEQVRKAGLAMSAEAEQLSQALRGNKQLLGAWGEMQLEVTLQAAGMVEGTHYLRQKTYRHSEDQSSSRLDFVINLPKNKHIVIDAKTTLNSYMDMTDAKDDAARTQAQQAFFQAIRAHATNLSSKDYHAISQLESPMYVLMYIPIESAYLMLLRENMKIFDEAYNKNIILVSHTTLLPVLRTISNLWVINESSTKSKEILAQAGGLYQQLNRIGTRLATLGARLNSSVNGYNELITAFKGRQGLRNKIDRFKDLSDKSQAEPPTLTTIENKCTNISSTDQDDNGTGSDDNGTGPDDISAGSDDNGTGPDDISADSDDNGAGPDDISADSDDISANLDAISANSDDNSNPQASNDTPSQSQQ